MAWYNGGNWTDVAREDNLRNILFDITYAVYERLKYSRKHLNGFYTTPIVNPNFSYWNADNQAYETWDIEPTLVMFYCSNSDIKLLLSSVYTTIDSLLLGNRPDLYNNIIFDPPTSYYPTNYQNCVFVDQNAPATEITNVAQIAAILSLSSSPFEGTLGSFRVNDAEVYLWFKQILSALTDIRSSFTLDNAIRRDTSNATYGLNRSPLIYLNTTSAQDSFDSYVNEDVGTTTDAYEGPHVAVYDVVIDRDAAFPSDEFIAYIELPVPTGLSIQCGHMHPDVTFTLESPSNFVFRFKCIRTAGVYFTPTPEISIQLFEGTLGAIALHSTLITHDISSTEDSTISVSPELFIPNFTGYDNAIVPVLNNVLSAPDPSSSPNDVYSMVVYLYTTDNPSFISKFFADLSPLLVKV